MARPDCGAVRYGCATGDRAAPALKQLAALVQMHPRALRQVVTADLAQQAVGAELPGAVSSA